MYNYLFNSSIVRQYIVLFLITSLESLTIFKIMRRTTNEVSCDFFELMLKNKNSNNHNNYMNPEIHRWRKKWKLLRHEEVLKPKPSKQTSNDLMILV